MNGVLTRHYASAPFRLGILWVAVLLASLPCQKLHAQFDGPSPPPAYGVNVHHPVTTDQAILYPPTPPFVFMTGDLLRIRVLNTTPEFNLDERVSLDGSISIPYAGTIHAAGLSIPQLEALLSERLVQAQMFNAPQLTIEVTEAPAHIATVVGAAHGTIPVLSSKRLYDVLAGVGGLPMDASNVVSIHRPGLSEPIVVDLGNDPSVSTGANVPVLTGDTITTGRVGSYYVVGAVKLPNMQPLTGSTPTTVLQALARSGGPLFEAKLGSAILIRTNGTRRSVIHVNLHKIERGKEPDPVLQTDDILLIPTDYILAAIRNGGIGTALAVAVTLTYL